jgi:hypothetical protein
MIHTQLLSRFAPWTCLGIALWFAAPGAAAPLEGYADEATWKSQLATIDASETATVTSLGVTAAGREVQLITLAKGDADKKPALLILGNVFAPQLSGSELATRLAQSLATPDEATKPAVDALLERFTLYIIPRPSPDATVACFDAPSRERAANTRPWDDDRDFETDEDGFEDLNGDGLITMLRIEDLQGEFIPHPNEPRVMIAADRAKQERGKYRLITEGVDNDHDEAFNEDPVGGVEFHRNFTFAYKFFQPGVGPHQVSEPETRAIADFCFAHPNIALVFSFSPEDNLFHPWKADDAAAQARIKTGLLPADAPALTLLSDRFKKLHGGTDAPESATYDGSFVRWAYFHYGRWSLASRAWWPPKVEPPKPAETPAPEAPAEQSPMPEVKPEEKKEEPKEDTRAADQLNALRWFAQQNIDGFVNWTPIEHPDFPGKKVEVGGFKPFLLLNPPAAELDGLAKKHLDFLVALPEMLPRVALQDVQAESVGAGLYRVTLLVMNEGQLPTFPSMGNLSDHAIPLQVTLTLPEGVKLLTGRARQQLAPIAGSGGYEKLEWLIHVANPATNKIQIRAAAPAVGEASTELELK